MTATPEERGGPGSQRQPTPITRPTPEWYFIRGQLVPRSEKRLDPYLFSGKFHVSGGRIDKSAVIDDVIADKLCTMDAAKFDDHSLEFSVHPADASRLEVAPSRYKLKRIMSQNSAAGEVVVWEGDCERGGKSYHAFLETYPVKRAP